MLADTFNLDLPLAHVYDHVQYGSLLSSYQCGVSWRGHELEIDLFPSVQRHGCSQQREEQSLTSAPFAVGVHGISVHQFQEHRVQSLPRSSTVLEQHCGPKFPQLATDWCPSFVSVHPDLLHQLFLLCILVLACGL